MKRVPPHNNEFEFAIRYYYKKYRHWFAVFVIGLFVLLVLKGTFYQVPAQSRAVVLRFGAFNREVLPGLRMKWPWPVEQAILVPVEKVRTEEFGFQTISAGRVTQYATDTESFKRVSRMLTGDLNLSLVEWIVQYRVNDAQKYLFRLAGDVGDDDPVRLTIRNVSESVMRELVGDHSIDEVLTFGREDIEREAEIKIQNILNQYESGVSVVTVKLQDATPPESVKDAFDAVNRARQMKEKVINEAEGEKNRRLPAARGQRDRMIAEAEGYHERIVLAEKGRAAAFLRQLEEYQKAPEITRMRLYIETMQDILSDVQDKIVIDESVRGMLPLLNLNGGSSLTGKEGR